MAHALPGARSVLCARSTRLKDGQLGYLGLDVYEEEAQLFFEDRSDLPLQDDVLAQRWLTLDRLLQAQQVWLATKRKGVPTYYRVPSPFLRRGESGRRRESIGFEGSAQDPDFSIGAQFELEFETVVADLAADGLPSSEYPVMLEIHRDTFFPDRLITGPWGNNDVKLLFWLGRAGASMSDNQSWEVRYAPSIGRAIRLYFAGCQFFDCRYEDMATRRIY
jgi:hypothetical protein